MRFSWAQCNHKGKKEGGRRVRVKDGDVMMEAGIGVSERFEDDTLLAVKVEEGGTSLVVQWLRLSASTAGGADLIPSQGTKIPQAVQHGQKKILKYHH